ncbi:unnamed protein product [Heligmosomoides polygyrus]|uniref:N-terminal Ras-GEF domain-containing protein n=1 Tax=Heligmosomoides polygyrus TaxID=6339 RepID=A0A183F8K8_HELPZ|nr:unnamed protein product [Heligmosomoides polygyrus]
MREQRLRWYGHALRRPEDHPTRLALDFEAPGKRPRGASRKRWRDVIKRDLAEVGTSRVTPDFVNLVDLLQDSEAGQFRLPSKWAEEEKEDDHAPQKAIDWLERRAITHVPETIYTLDASQYLVMRTREDPSKPPEVRGGPRDALIVHATELKSSVLYQEAFLVTYRTFISSHDLVNKLITRSVIAKPQRRFGGS